MRKKKFLIIGRTSTGKSSIAREVCNRLGLRMVVSYTTRPMREGEKQYSDHIFIDSAEVNKYKDDIAAYTEINGYEYFTTFDILDNSDVYVIDPIGVDNLKNKTKGRYEFIEIYIRTPRSIAEERARKRGDHIKTFRDRWAAENAQFLEYENRCDFNYNLLNDGSFEESVERVCSLIWNEIGDEIMIERNIFITKINRKHKFGDNSFIKGKIMGIAEALDIARSKEGMSYGIVRDGDYWIIRTYCTHREYARFVEIVKKNYGDNPFEGLVEFDI